MINAGSPLSSLRLPLIFLRIRGPGEHHSLAMCFTRAQAFLAASRYEVATDQYFKVVCGRPRLPANLG
jgi:hypothetical protein